MKKIIFTIFMIATAFVASSQTILMPSGNAIDSITTCTGTFYDTGGSNGNHGINQSSTMIFRPGTIGMAVRLVFSTFSVAEGATMTIYDGVDNTAAVIAVYDANISPIGLDVVATSDNPTGAVTVEFTSGTNNEVGWAATVDCRAPCQAYTIGIDPFTTTKPLVDSIYFNVCLGETVTFCATGNYPQNGNLYFQSDSTTTFSWQFGTNEGVVEGQCITRTFDHFQGWDFVLTAQDEQNCYPTAIFKGRVRVSDNPLQNVQELPDMCSGTVIPILMDTSDNATIGIGVVSNAVSGTLSVADTTFLPDGSNISYTSDLTYSIFEPGQTLNDISDLLGICLSLEHSYLGDLRIRITCPSGQTCLLKAYSSSDSAPAGIATAGSSSGGNIHLGFAPDPSSNNPCYLTPGVGLDYCFTPQATAGMGSGGPTTNITYTDPCGNTESWNQLNAGDYGSYENMTALLGCQLNGAWRITVTDCLASDNGYIFSWGLSLSDRIIPGGWGYDVDLANVTWSGYNIEPTQNDSVLFAANINADAPGDYTYTVTMEDEYACVYDTTFFVTIVQTPEPRLGDDVSLCIGESTTLNPNFNYLGTPGTIAYSWTTINDGTEINNTETFTVADSNQYIITITTNNDDNTLQCVKSDTINVLLNPQPIADFEGDLLENCAPLNVTLHDLTTYTDNEEHSEITLNYQWSIYNQNDEVLYSSTEGNPSFSIIDGGIYHVGLIVTTPAGCADTIIKQNYLTVYPQPIADFVANPERTNLAEGGTITFLNITDTNVFSDNDVPNWIWEYGAGGDATHDFNGTYTYDSWGEFIVTLTVLTDKGCTSNVTHTVYIEADLVFPNVITPNGDNFNDVFAIENMNPKMPNILSIYNRWGKKVYEKENYQTYMKDGILYNADEGFDAETLSDGVYYFTFHYEGYTRAIDFHGSLTILRN